MFDEPANDSCAAATVRHTVRLSGVGLHSGRDAGLLIEPDAPGALADAILSLIDDPEWARRLGAQGRERVEQELNWRRFTEKSLGAAGFATEPVREVS